MPKPKPTGDRLKLLRLESKPVLPSAWDRWECAWHRECEYLDTKTRERYMFAVKEFPNLNEITWRAEWWWWHRRSKTWKCWSGEYCTAERSKVEVVICGWLTDIHAGLGPIEPR